MSTQPHPQAAPELVLAKAVLSAAAQLGLKQAELAAVLGVVVDEFLGEDDRAVAALHGAGVDDLDAVRGRDLLARD